MGKLFNSMIFGAVSTMALLLLDSSGATPTSLILLLLNPVAYSTNGFYQIFFGVAGLTALTGFVVIGVGAVIKQDWLIRAGFIGSLSSIVIFPFIDLFRFVVAKTNYIALNCTTSPVCSSLNSIQGVGQIIGFIFVAPFFLYALWACVNYVWTGESNG